MEGDLDLDPDLECISKVLNACFPSRSNKQNNHNKSYSQKI